MVTLSNLQRCVSVTSCAGNSSNNSVASSSDSVENPFMTLVDAAASLLDKSPSKEMEDATMSPSPTATPPAESVSVVSPLSAKIPFAVEVKNNSAPPLLDSQAPFSKPKSKNNNKKQTFAELLMSVLDDPVNQEVMCWMPDGSSFTICNHKKFTMDLMPMLFNIRNMSSFVRKLGRWGFSRVHERETRNSDIFKHKNFQQHNWELCKTIKCVGREKSSKCTRPSSCIIDLVVFDQPHGHSVYGSSTLIRNTTRMPERRIACSHTMIATSGDKALLRLEHARRLSAQSRPSAFRSHGLGSMAHGVVEAAIETLRRDEETVIVAMPKKYLQHRGRVGPPPGVRVLSTSSGDYGLPSAYPASQFNRSSFVRHGRRQQQQSGRPIPVSLITRPTNSGVERGLSPSSSHSYSR